MKPKIPARQHNRNPVAKFMPRFNRPARLANRKVYQRRPKHQGLDNQV